MFSNTMRNHVLKKKIDFGNFVEIRVNSKIKDFQFAYDFFDSNMLIALT